MSCTRCLHDSLAEKHAKGQIQTDHPEDYKNITTCARHGGGMKLEAQEKKRVHDYIITKAAHRNGHTVSDTFERFASSSQVTSLRGEIAILRHMIENIYNDCAGEPDKLFLYSSRLSDLIVKCEKLVNTCNRIEIKADMFLNETLALQFSFMIIEIIKLHIKDTETIKRISEEIPRALANVVNV